MIRIWPRFFVFLGINVALFFLSKPVLAGFWIGYGYCLVTEIVDQWNDKGGHCN